MELNPKLFAGSLNGLQGRTVRGRRGSKQHADPGHVRHGLRQYLKLLGDELGEHDRQPCDVAAGPREARHDADGIGMGVEYYGDRLRRLSGGFHLS